MDATVVVATFNRASLLDQTLQSLRGIDAGVGRRWDAIVVDNNSTDETRRVIERHAATFPVPLRYLFEPRQGRSSALNTGMAAAQGVVIATTDDDVLVERTWLATACDALLRPADPAIAYAGGPVRPRWETTPPPWLDRNRGDLWGTIAIQDHGDRTFVYEEQRKVPLGANMAIRKSLVDAIGGFRAELGRGTGRLVLGQEVPEFLMRARNAGFKGIYLPSMCVHHHIPAGRLTRRYFRRWWFGKGVSRSRLESVEPLTELGVDLRKTPHLLNVPRYMYGSAVRDAAGWMRHSLAGSRADAFRHQMMLVYFAGYFWGRRGTTPVVRTPAS